MLDRPGHAARRVVLGQAIGRENVGEDFRAGMAVGGIVQVVGPRELLERGVRPLTVKRVIEWGFVRLVVRRQRSVGEAGGDEDPASPIRLHYEGLVAPDRFLGLRVIGRLVVGMLGRAYVRHVVAGPAPLLLVPPDVLLALGPGPPFRVCGGAGVDDATVHWPRP